MNGEVLLELVIHHLLKMAQEVPLWSSLNIDEDVVFVCSINACRAGLVELEKSTEAQKVLE